MLIAGTGAESAIETLRLTEYAAALGYDAALVRTPHFYRPQMQPANLLAFYRTVADRSPLPILIYSVPVFTNYDMAAELVIELAGHPNIIGIKESGGDVEKIRRMAEARGTSSASATVTETFDCGDTTHDEVRRTVYFHGNNELIPIGALAGTTTDLWEGYPQRACPERPTSGRESGSGGATLRSFVCVVNSQASRRARKKSVSRYWPGQRTSYTPRSTREPLAQCWHSRTPRRRVAMKSMQRGKKAMPNWPPKARANLESIPASRQPDRHSRHEIRSWTSTATTAARLGCRCFRSPRI